MKVVDLGNMNGKLELLFKREKTLSLPFIKLNMIVD